MFELICAPLVRTVARRYGYIVEEAPQTVYPDFTLVPSKDAGAKLAIDVKTTYRRGRYGDGREKPFRYTLGSYTSFLRSGTKNILYPYSEYAHHWVIGFLYSRVTSRGQGQVLTLRNRERAEAPYGQVEYFIQEKFKIVGETPASGNTTNIGSFPTGDIDDLREGRGPFAKPGKELCDDYWRNFDPAKRSRPYSSLSEYLQHFGKQP